MLFSVRAHQRLVHLLRKSAEFDMILTRKAFFLLNGMQQELSKSMKRKRTKETVFAGVETAKPCLSNAKPRFLGRNNEHAAIIACIKVRQLKGGALISVKAAPMRSSSSVPIGV